jgi:hypothetical protein
MMTFVTHLRYDNPDRIQNLNTIINYYGSNIKNCKFIFIEDDKEHNKVFDSVKFIKGSTKFSFVENNSTYYRTRALNIGMKMATHDVVVSLDTDCIVPIKSMMDCYEALMGDATVAWPYNGYFVDVGEPLRSEIINSSFNHGDILNRLDGKYTMPLTSVYKQFLVRCTSKDHLGTGGIVMFNKKRFLSIGGYNENFIGWGCEDNEIVSRVDILGHKKFRDTDVQSICFHLYHRSAERAENPFFDKNSVEWHKIKAMNKEQLLEYIKSWHWLKTNE